VHLLASAHHGSSGDPSCHTRHDGDIAFAAAWAVEPLDRLRLLATDVTPRSVLRRVTSVAPTGERASEIARVLVEPPSEPLAFASFADLERVALACTKCPLSETRTQVVFGAGDPEADLMFVGEGPGEQEDRDGIPFVGRAGRLLTSLIEGIGLDRDVVYIANVVSAGRRNRDPQPGDRQLPPVPEADRLHRSAVVVTLGNFANSPRHQGMASRSCVAAKFPFREPRLLMPTLHLRQCCATAVRRSQARGDF
jgi:DNA polymerase